MSQFVLDASYTLTWCFSDRATPNTDAALRRLEPGADSAIAPPVWSLEVGNAMGKAVVRKLLPLATNDEKLSKAAQSYGIAILAP